jgi:hypothetical protein
MLPLTGNAFQAAHVGPERFWNQDRAVGLLIVFDNRHPCASHGQPAAVQGVNELELALGTAGPVTDVRSPRLEGVEVRAGGDFPVKLLAGEPDLQIEGLGRGEAGVYVQSRTRR